MRILVGVVKISHAVINGMSLVNSDGFASANQWEKLATAIPILSAAKNNSTEKERGHDELQLHSNFAVSDLSSALPTPLSRWLAGEKCSCRHAS